MGLGKFFKAATNIIKNPVQLITIAVAVSTGNYWYVAAAISTATYGNYQTIKLEEKQKAAEKAARDAYNGALQDRLVNVISSEAPYQVIYGQARVGGAIAAVLKSGDKDQYRHIVVVHAAHEVEEIGEIFVGDFSLGTLDGDGNCTTGRYANQVRVKKHLGIANDPADASLIAEVPANWTSAHLLRGFAYTVVRIDLNQADFQGGLPQINAIIKGKKLYDPRTATTVWSDNPALCIYDYLTQNYGRGQPASNLVTQSFIDAADACDEVITVGKRYTCNGSFKTDQDPKQVLDALSDSMCGFTYQSGGWNISAGVYTEPVMALDENDLVGGVSINISTSLADTFNSINGQFSNPAKNYVVTDFTPFKNATFIEDDEQELFTDFTLHYTNTDQRCQNIARIVVERARQGLVVTMPCTLKAWPLQCGDRVTVTNATFGWDAKVFRVINWSFNTTAPVELVLQEDAPEVYDEADAIVPDESPNTNLPNPFDVATPVIQVTDTVVINAEQVITVLAVTVTSQTAQLVRYEVQAKLTTDTEWINLGQASGNKFELLGAYDGLTYDIRARAINALNASSEYATATRQIVGKTAPPEDVTGFSINIVGTSAYMTWNPVGDADLSHYRIRHSSETTGATYSNSVDLVAKVPRPSVFAIAPAMTGTYFIKALDKLGNESINATEVVAIIEDIKGLNAIETVTESPSFSGIKTECNVTEDGYLVLDTSIDFDAKTGDFDDADGDFDGGGGFVSTEGTYEFANIVDLSQVYTSRVTAFLEVERADYVNLFDDAEGNFDDRPGLFDGDPNTYGDTNVALFVATTEDDPSSMGATWTEYRRFFVGDYKARGLKFKAVLTSTSGESSPILKTLTVNIDMPDRVTAGDDIASGTDSGGYAVTFSPSFKAIPALGISAQNLQQGDYYEITTKSASGFTIRFKNTSGTVVNRTFDYVAKGYGELAA